MREIYMDADKPNQTYRMHGVKYAEGITYMVSDKDASYLTKEVLRGDGKPLFRHGKAPEPKRDDSGIEFGPVDVEAEKAHVRQNDEELAAGIQKLIDDGNAEDSENPNDPRTLKRKQRRGKQE